MTMMKMKNENRLKTIPVNGIANGIDACNAIDGIQLVAHPELCSVRSSI